MASKKEVPQQPAGSPDPVVRAASYTRDELLLNAEALFAVKPEVVTGALFGSVRETYTIQETERLIRQFQTRKVLS